MASRKYASLCSGVSSVFESTAVLHCDQNGAQSMRSPLKVGRWSLGSWIDLDFERVVVEVEDEGVDSLSAIQFFPSVG